MMILRGFFGRFQFSQCADLTKIIQNEKFEIFVKIANGLRFIFEDDGQNIIRSDMSRMLQKCGVVEKPLHQNTSGSVCIIFS